LRQLTGEGIIQVIERKRKRERKEGDKKLSNVIRISEECHGVRFEVTRAVG
jgi:hypothetical protein